MTTAAPQSTQSDFAWLRQVTERCIRMELDDAVRRFVGAGACLFIPSDCQAAVRAISRRFSDGERGNLTLVCMRVGASHVGELVEVQAVAKILGSSFSYPYPATRPVPPIQRAYREGRVELECWSLYTLTQRLMAGGTGISYMPTTSLVGSDMTSNEGFCWLTDSATGKRIPAVAALRPDVTFVHALAADQSGNAIVAPPFEDDLWSTRAARAGVIILAENIVPTDFLRERPDLVKVPAYRALAVCHVPYAAHPEGYSPGVALDLPITGYQRDNASYREYVEASSDTQRFNDLIRVRSLKCVSHSDYVRRFFDRKRLLSKAARPDVNAAYRNLGSLPDFTPGAADWMTVVAARRICSAFQETGAVNLLIGTGAAGLAGALAYYLLRRQSIHITLLEGIGRIGFEPLPIDDARRATALMLAGTTEVYGSIVSPADRRSIALLGAAEIDVKGNLNSTISADTFIVGAGGANDAVSGAARTIAMVRQSQRRLVERVEYVSCPGETVVELVTDRGLFLKNADGRFHLSGIYVFDDVDADADKALENVIQTCGWTVTVSPALEYVEPPNAVERQLLSWLRGDRSNAERADD
jgi:acyl CoA:acetate/3-ketoacid CoA transferase alpha subunit/acyl CoA:acetate/3-ketoacid CoA transferase beta subunit